MAKSKPVNGVSDDHLGTSNRPLTERLLLLALPRNGHPLRPYAPDVKTDDLNTAIENLRARGLVHGPRHEPNLTLEGRDAARALAAHQQAAA